MDETANVHCMHADNSNAKEIESTRDSLLVHVGHRRSDVRLCNPIETDQATDRSAVASRRSRGVRPVQRLKARVKFAALSNPSRTEIACMSRLEVSSKWRASR